MMSQNDAVHISVKPDKTRLQNLLDEIAAGAIKVPVFQRDFVWKPLQMIELFDSILKGYPIGSLLFWRPEVEFKTKDFIGPYKVLKQATNVGYVLDGYQRITTLFGALMNPKKMNYVSEVELRDFSIYYNLKEKEFVYYRNKKREIVPYLIPLYKAVDTFEFLDFLRDIENYASNKEESKILIDNAKELNKILYDYELPFVEIKGGDIKSAVEIFSRINSTGTEISEDFMLSALSYNKDTNFLFSDYITEFVNSLNVYNFEGLKRDTILNCIANSKGKLYFDVKIEELLKPDLEILTKTSFEHIAKAVEFLSKELLVLDVRLLPYPTQLIFISEYFRMNERPTDSDIFALKRWFWTTTYSNYFTLYSLSQQRVAYKEFVDFAHGNHPDGILRINVEDTFTTAKFPEKLNFTGVRTKALQLFLLNHAYNKDDVQVGDTIREMFIFNKKDRTPGNIILRLNSDVTVEILNSEMPSFIWNNSQNELDRFFINDSIANLYLENKIEEFIEHREALIKVVEADFVRQFQIRYDDAGYF